MIDNNVNAAGGSKRPPLKNAPTPRVDRDDVQSGATLVEHDGKMVSQDALTALNMAVGNQAEDMRYDANGDGRLTPGDALEFAKYAEMENYGDDSGFMSVFYGDQPGGMDGNSTFTDQVPGYVVDGEEFMGPDMAPPPGRGAGFDFGAPANLGDTHYDPQLDTTYTYQEKYDGDKGLYSGWDITEGTGRIMTGGPALPAPTPITGGPLAPTPIMGETMAPPPVPVDVAPPPPPDNPFATPPVPGGVIASPGIPLNSFNPVSRPVVPNDPTVGIPPMPNPFDPAPPPVFGGPAPVNPFPQLPTGAQGGRTYGNAPVFGGFNPGRNIPTDEFGNPIAVPYSNGGIAGLRR